MALLRRCWRSLCDERGSAEASMVLVPLIILFLIGIQLSLSTHSRNLAKMKAQDQASVRAISGHFLDSDSFLHIDSSGDGQNLDLIVTRKAVSIPNLLAGGLGVASSPRSVDVEGLAIVENQR